MVFKAKVNNITDLPIDSNIYTRDDRSVYLFYEHEKEM